MDAETTPFLNQTPAELPRPQAAEGADGWVEEKHFRVILNLVSDDWVELASFADEESAEACARDMAVRLASTGEWPRVRGRYLRPETIVAVEISERRRMTGSQMRERYWHGVEKNSAQ